MHLGIPQIVLLVLWLIGLIVTAYNHETIGRVNVWSKVVNVAINLGLLYWGGFFK